MSVHRFMTYEEPAGALNKINRFAADPLPPSIVHPHPARK